MSSELVERLKHAHQHSQQRVLGSHIFGEAAARIEALEAQLAEARKVLADYDRWLNGRDAYIVQKGLWQNFVASLPGSPTTRRAREGGNADG